MTLPVADPEPPAEQKTPRWKAGLPDMPRRSADPEGRVEWTGEIGRSTVRGWPEGVW